MVRACGSRAANSALRGQRGAGEQQQREQAAERSWHGPGLERGGDDQQGDAAGGDRGEAAGRQRPLAGAQVEREREREGGELERPVREHGGGHPCAVGAERGADDARR